MGLAPLALDAWTAVVGACLGVGTFLFGHTIGLHRGVIHRAFEMPRALRNGLVWVFVLTGLGGPLSWIYAHNQRDHWQNRLDAPAWFRYDHGRWRDAWWNLHTVFVESVDHVPEPERSDPWLCFLERTWWLHNLGLFATLALLGGWQHVVIGGLLRVWLSLLLHWFVGYEAHAAGTLRYPIHGAAESGRNRALLGVLSLGEGFHNNHHAFPDSARIGHRPLEWDAGWWVIQRFQRAGWMWNVKTWPHVPRRGAEPGGP